MTGGHIDILRLHAPKVSEIRDAITFVSKKPVEGAYRTVVAQNADDMTASAANSMLKTLEEPPENTVMILHVRSVSGVLPTVASRCSAIYLAPDPDAERAIRQRLGIDETTAHILADLSGGFVEEAAILYQDTGVWPLRAKMLEYCEKLLRQKGFAISACADFLEDNREHITFLLCVMQSFFRDILVYKKAENKQLIINRDKTEDIADSASHFTSGAISNMMNAILETERRLVFSVNFRLSIEKMFFDILEGKTWRKS